MINLFVPLLLAAILLAISFSIAARTGLLMRNIYIVEVPAGKKPLFQDRCIVCRDALTEPRGTLVVTPTHGRMEYYMYGFTKPYPDEYQLPVPVHDPCSKGIRNGFLGRLFLMVAMAASIGAVALFNRWSGFSSAMLTLVILTPLLYFEFTRPLPVEYLLLPSGKFIFLFQDKSYAEDFSRLNGSPVREGTYPYESTYSE